MSTSYWLTFGNSTCGFNGKGVGWEPPIVLPPYTIRLKFTEGVTPTFAKGTGTRVSSSPNVWDLTYTDVSWNGLLRDQVDLLEVIAANTTGVTNMVNMLRNCTSLYRVASFDTSAVTNMAFFLTSTNITESPAFNLSSCIKTTCMYTTCPRLAYVPSMDLSQVIEMDAMFRNSYSLEYLPDMDCSSCRNMQTFCEGCQSLKEIPQITVSSSLEYVTMAFENCKHVESGALAFYQQASQYAPTPSHSGCFTNCGDYAPVDAPIHAEMQQIPSSWGGNGA